MAEQFDTVYEPRACPGAFAERDPASRLSQAAFLLSLAPLLHVDGASSRLVSAERYRMFPLPSLPLYQFRFDIDAVEAASVRFDFNLDDVRANPDRLAQVLFRVAGSLYSEQPQAIDAAVLAVLASYMDDPLIAVCADVAQADLLVQTGPALERLRAMRERADGSLAGQIATVALARMGSPISRERSSALADLVNVAPEDWAPMPLADPEAPADALVLIHGTTMPGFPGDGISPSWWRPGEPFQLYLKQGPRPDVYDGPTPFAWGGGWSDETRDVGAKALRTWLNERDILNPDFVTHSHGGNMLLHAIRHYGVAARNIVVTSCPVHSIYSLDRARVSHAASIRIEMDLIILADRGGQRFEDDALIDHVLGHWFVDHSDPLRPDIWEAQRFVSLLG